MIMQSRKVSLSDINKKFSEERFSPFPGEKLMNQSKSRYAIQKILDLADVHINGHRPWDIRVRNQNFHERVLAGGSLALGESYMDGWWNCEALDQLFDRIMSAYLDKQAKKSAHVLAAPICSADQRPMTLESDITTPAMTSLVSCWINT
jgi:hypothetical protein